jgi:gas vesicle protein
MSDRNSAILNTTLTFLAGAAVGAVVVALTTSKSGPELRGDLKALGRRIKGKAEGYGEEAGASWDRLKETASEAASEIRTAVNQKV